MPMLRPTKMGFVECILVGLLVVSALPRVLKYRGILL
jgi:hypothetical protein